jgi:beclin 1
MAEVSALDAQILALKGRIQASKKKKIDAHLRRFAIAKDQHQARLIRDAALERINSLTFESMLLKEQLDAMTEEATRVAVKLQRCMQINPINDAFYVWYSGPYGTINNFRLGNIPLKPVDWNEINAALGQALLAISTVATKAGYEYKKYTLSPMGSFSKVYKMEDKRTPLTLYSDGSFSLFPKRNFNSALTGFLSCVQELGEFTKSKDPTLQLPYAINVIEGKVYDQIILLGSDDEMWTRALKFLLTDVKWIIAWASKHCSGSVSEAKAIPKRVAEQNLTAARSK